MTYRIWGTEDDVRTRSGTSVDRDFIGTLPTGGYVVGWREGQKLYFQIYTSTGVKMGGPHAVSTSGAVYQNSGTIQAVGNDGSFAISWNESTGSVNSSAIKTSVFNASGALVGSTRTVVDNQSLGQLDTPSLARYGDTGFLTVYNTNDSLRLAAHNLDGTVRSDINVLQMVGLQYPDIVELGGDRFLLSYARSGSIKYRMIDLASGTPIGSEVAVANGTYSDTVVQKNAAGVATGFAVVYSNGASVVAQFYNLAGVKGTTVDITTSGLYDGDYISSVALRDGRVAVVYSEKSPDDNGDIYLKVVDGNGNATEKLLLNSHAATDKMSQQYTPQISEMADGRLAVTWYDPAAVYGLISTTIVDARIAPVTVTGTGVNDVYIGTEYAGDRLLGMGGNDILTGGLGGDTIDGGDDIDTASFQFATAGVAASLDTNTGTAGEAAGDTYISIENLLGSNYADTLTGGDGSNYLWGGGGNDALTGSCGADTLDGGAGNDIYYINDAAHAIVEAAGGGTDYIYTSVSYSLASAPNVEYMYATGNAAITLTGSNTANIFVGNSAANTFIGLGGDDTYYVGVGDQVVEGSGQGYDRVYANFSYALDATADIEELIAYGVNAISLTGSNTANRIIGTRGNDVLKGQGGNDALLGNAGRDALYGGIGNDKLYGGLDSDVLKGDAGKDIFVFDTKLHASKNVDKILDFSVKDDTIWLDNAVFKKLGSGSPTKPKKLAADMFHIGTSAHDASDRIIYNKKTGVLYYDPDGIGGAAAIKFAVLSKNLKMTYADFYVI
ncbi:calcium-binding protein [Microvirga terricola]|uniref:Calcium-binding protein n=1 Tax=Microvirga terricola TaxID=2719797 RepID=A0ABX0VBF1_9HYPH|nr:calcium-binding protein [Microvirga terricola]